MTIYMKVMPKPKIFNNQDQPCIPLPDDATLVDEYYADQNIAYGIFYNVLDLSILKLLAELIREHLLRRKSSFERVSHQDELKLSADSTVAVIKRLIPRSKWESRKQEEKTDIDESCDLQADVRTQLEDVHVRPGENGWRWTDTSQPSGLLEILATLWENVEEAYVETVKENLFLKRVHVSNIMLYRNLVMENLTKFVNRPDKRQMLVQDFHRKFNEVDEDFRDDPDTKCELHCRVSKI